MQHRKVRRSHTGGSRYAWYVVVVLMLANLVALIDRQIISLIVEPIKQDLQVTDTQVGLLAGLAFAIFYSVLGIPIARLSDRLNRRNIIIVGVAVWNVMALACGFAKNYPQLFLARIGVGVGEACLAPAVSSLIADYFPPKKVAQAMSVYVMGLYLGTGLAMIGSSYIVRLAMEVPTVILPWVGQLFSWQIAFLVSALLGLPLIVLLLSVREPPRVAYTPDGLAHPAVMRKATWLEIQVFLTQRWKFFLALIVGGASIGTVITAWLIWVPEVMRRTHGWDVTDAGIAYGFILVAFGMPGAFFGGWFASWLSERGYRDAEMRSILIGVSLLLPFAVAVPLAPNSSIMLWTLCPLIFFLSWPQGLAPAMLALVTPNHFRAQVTAVFMLFASLSGYTAGGALVAIVSQHLLQDESLLNVGLSVISAIFVPLAIAMFWYGLRHYAVARLGTRDIVAAE